MAKIIIAIGGEDVGALDENGHSKRVICKSFHQEILARTGKKHPSVLYIPTAKNDCEDYIAGFQKFYTDLGCEHVEVLRLIHDKPLKQEIEHKIFSADAIYVNGGNSFRMLRVWKRYGIDQMLKKAWQQGTVMSGHSAGSLCWFSYACSDAFSKQKPFKATAMGWIDALLCPHYDTELVRQVALKKIMKRTPKIIAIGLDEYAAIEIVDDTYRILTGTSDSKARKIYWKQGQYMIEDIPCKKTFQLLRDLLQKL